MGNGENAQVINFHIPIADARYFSIKFLQIPSLPGNGSRSTKSLNPTFDRFWIPRPELLLLRLLSGLFPADAKRPVINEQICCEWHLHTHTYTLDKTFIRKWIDRIDLPDCFRETTTLKYLHSVTTVPPANDFAPIFPSNTVHLYILARKWNFTIIWFGQRNKQEETTIFTPHCRLESGLPANEHKLAKINLARTLITPDQNDLYNSFGENLWPLVFR